MFDLHWVAAGLVSGFLISSVLIPPTRKEKSVPSPSDNSIYHTDTGCVRFTAVEVPCVDGADSLNALASVASVAKKQWSTSLTSFIAGPPSSPSSSASA